MKQLLGSVVVLVDDALGPSATQETVPMTFPQTAAGSGAVTGEKQRE